MLLPRLFSCYSGKCGNEDRETGVAGSLVLVAEIESGLEAVKEVFVCFIVEIESEWEQKLRKIYCMELHAVQMQRLYIVKFLRYVV